MVKTIPDMNMGGSVANGGEDSRSVESCDTLEDMLSTDMTRGTGNMGRRSSDNLAKMVSSDLAIRLNHKRMRCTYNI